MFILVGMPTKKKSSPFSPTHSSALDLRKNKKNFGTVRFTGPCVFFSLFHTVRLSSSHKSEKKPLGPVAGDRKECKTLMPHRSTKSLACDVSKNVFNIGSDMQNIARDMQTVCAVRCTFLGLSKIHKPRRGF